MNSLDKILGRLQGKSPAVDDENLFVENIMNRLPDKQKQRRIPLWKNLLMSASIAAVLIMVAYINKQDTELVLLNPYYTELAKRHETDFLQFNENSNPQEIYEYYMRRKPQQLSYLQLKNKIHEKF